MNFIDSLRDLYRKGDMAGLERTYKLGKWRLTAEEQKKIEAILPKRDLTDLQRKAQETFGGQWFDK